MREALVNVARHAPAARVRVRCEVVSAGLDLEVVDDGTSTNRFERGTGTGLRGLTELVATVGGRLEHGTLETGFRVAAHLPCDVRVPA